jgi:hypothetical protein
MTFFNIYNWRKKAIPLLISGLIISCSPLNPLGLASQQYTAIAELGKLANKSSVNLQGMVVNIAPFLDGGAYQLQDATGLIWVRTNKPLPPKGTSLSIQGEIQYEAIFVGQQQLGESYLLEVSQEAQSSTISPQATPNSTPKPPVTSTNPNIPSSTTTPPVEPNKTIAVPVIESSPPVPSPIPTPSVEVKEPTSSPTPIASPQTAPIASPEPAKIPIPVPSPTTKSAPSPSTNKIPDKLNLDDRFLPHKRLQK